MSGKEDWKRSPHIAGRRPDTRGLPVDETIKREKDACIEMLVEDLIGEGWEPEAARNEAIRRFGNPERFNRKSGAIMRANDRKLQFSLLLNDFLKDTIYALRTLRKAPGFTLMAILILAIGIGANVAIFSMLKGMILRPMPFPEPDRIVAIWETERGRRSYQPFTSPDYFDMREQNTSFQEFGVYTFRWVNVLAEDESERVRGVIATASVLRALGIPPLHGRLFTEEEESEDLRKVVVLGNEYWKQRFEADPDLIGNWITLNRESHLVIGIMPEHFEFPSPWGRAEPVKLWMPAVLSRDNSGRGSHWLAALGRLNDGVKVRQAEADLKNIAARLSQDYPNTNTQVDVWIDPLMRRALGGITGALLLLLSVVGFVLLVACANVASMLLARGAARQSEVAIRLSLGAGKRRLMRQLLTESMILSVLGGIGGTFLAFWSLGTLKGMFPSTVPRVEGIQIDGWVFFFAFIIMLVTGLIFGLAPALFSARTNLIGALTGGGGSRTGGRKRNRALSFLVIVQLAIALMLMNSAILLFVSYLNVARVPQGFDTEEVLIASVQLTGPGYVEKQGRVAFWEQLIERLEASPGVSRAAVTSKLPTSGGTNSSILVEGETHDLEAHRPLVEFSYVTPGYFEAMGITLMQGKGIDQSDIALALTDATDGNIVVNRAFVEYYWPEEGNAVGRRVRENSEESSWSASIVGVVEDVRQWGILYPALPEIYSALSASSRTDCSLVLRTERDPTSMVPLVRETVNEIDPYLPVDGFRTMADMVHEHMLNRRSLTLLIGLFTLIAVILAAAGTYGVMSFHVTQRTHEIGVRVALGAGRRQVMWHFISRGLRLTLAGGGIGIWLAFAGIAIMSNMIFGVQAIQLLYLLLGIIMLGGVVFTATAIPAMRATRVDPVEALRTE